MFISHAFRYFVIIEIELPENKESPNVLEAIQVFPHSMERNCWRGAIP